METLKQLLSINFNYILIGLIVVFYSFEQLFQTQFRFKKRQQHLFHNIMLQVAFSLVNIVWAIVTVFFIEWLNNHHVGLFYVVQVPVWVKLILGVVLFDFVTYWFHRAAHKVSLIWRLHRVHHSDSTMDASTTFRGHPFEVIWFGVSNILAAAVFGLDLTALGLYFLVATPFFFLEHSNLRFPVWIDKTVGLIITTPNLHKIHHEQDQHYTDSNFADIVILWDRIFGTYTYKPVDQITFGLKEFETNQKQTFWYLLISPFINMNRVNSNQLTEKNQSGQILQPGIDSTIA
jgi:sterol desaturase/sphingolipid hydroxylase (fatty acid hydroxylase superfamily)